MNHVACKVCDGPDPCEKRLCRGCRPIYRTVVSHHTYIFTSPTHRTYKGMKFHPAWDPKTGGSYTAAARWILAHLGPRPLRQSLNIKKHKLGFVPNNLAWASRRIQAQNRRHYLTLVQQLRRENARLRRKIKQLTF